MLSGFGAHAFGEVFVAGLREAACDAALAVDAQGDVGGMVSVPEGVELRRDIGLRDIGFFEELRDAFLRIAGDSNFLQSFIAGINEDEKIAVAGVRARGSDELGERIVVEFFVDHDPHVHVMAAHHVEQQRLPLYQPALAHGNLLRPGQQVRHLVLERLCRRCRWLRLRLSSSR